MPINWFSNNLRWKHLGYAGFGLILCSYSAHAEFNRPITSGVVYPTIAESVSKDPAALKDDNLRVGRLNYDPNDGYSMMMANSQDSWGYGIALDTLGKGELVLGAGTGGQIWHFGLNMSLPELPGDADFGAGLIIGANDGWRVAFDFTSILKNDSDKLTIGLGFAKNNSYQLEFDLITSPSTLDGPSYGVHAEAVKNLGGFSLGVMANTTATTSPLGLGTIDLGGVLAFGFGAQTSVDLTYTTGDTGGFGFGVMARL